MLSWKLKATTFNRCYFQLQVSVPSTSATGFGLSPTPTAADSKRSSLTYGGGNQTLPGGLIGTPRASSAMASPLRSGTPDKGRLEQQLVNSAFLPTPQASDAKRGKAEHIINANGRPFAPQLTDVLGHSLNPHFVLEMMGFPPDWCDLTAPAS